MKKIIKIKIALINSEPNFKKNKLKSISKINKLNNIKRSLNRNDKIHSQNNVN